MSGSCPPASTNVAMVRTACPAARPVCSEGDCQSGRAGYPAAERRAQTVEHEVVAAKEYGACNEKSCSTPTSLATTAHSPRSLSSGSPVSRKSSNPRALCADHADTECTVKRSYRLGVAEACALLDPSASDNKPGVPTMPYSLDDVELIECFYDMARLADSEPTTLKQLLRAVMLLRSCKYAMEDICVVLAHTSIYFNDLIEKCGNSMGPGEAGNIIVLLMYLAHSYIQDEHCPLKFWHKYLFRDYCNVRTLNKAIASTMRLRGYILRVDQTEMNQRFTRLVSCTKKAPRECTLL